MNSDTSTKTYDIPEYQIDALRTKAKRYERRARKLGLAPFELVEGEPINKPVHKNDDENQPIVGYRRVIPCQLIGAAPVLAGWRFVAKVEHLGVGNLLSYAPDFWESEIVPADIRDSAPTCDHCGTKRQRNETFVVQHDDGTLKRVGRSCLKDFCGTKDAAAAVAIWALMHELEIAGDFDESGGMGGWAVYPTTEWFVACAFRSVDLVGWAPSRENSSTRDAALWASSRPGKFYDKAEENAWQNAQPREQDARDAQAAIAWARELSGSNYEHNLSVAVRLPCVDRKHAGIIASLTVAYKRHLEQEIERVKREKLGERSEHFGTTGHRYLRRVTLRGSRIIESRYDFSLVALYTFEDEDGNLLKWFTSPGDIYLPDGKDLDLGGECWLTFTVKRHGEYQDVKDTTIYRCRTAAGPEVAKWLGDDGEIFKSKKALLAA